MQYQIDQFKVLVGNPASLEELIKKHYHIKQFEYKILNLNQALLNTKAPTIGLSYQEFKRQILGDALYEDKSGESYLDPLFASKIKTDRLKKIVQRTIERRKNKSGK